MQHFLLVHVIPVLLSFAAGAFAMGKYGSKAEADVKTLETKVKAARKQI